MPRSRNIKPGFFSDDELANLDPIARLFFIGLWCHADYRGNIEWRPKRLKATILPYDDADLDSIAINLDQSGFIRFYSDGEKMYFNVEGFRRHQNPHKNERDSGSDIPDYTDEYRQMVDLNGITINRDLSRSDRDIDGTDPADSLNLIPDSLNLIPAITSDAPKLKNADRFEEWYSEYPVKKSRAPALKSWIKQRLDRKADELIKTLKTQKANDRQWIDGYAPHPSTYLNGKKWEDEIDTRNKNQQQQSQPIKPTLQPFPFDE